MNLTPQEVATIIEALRYYDWKIADAQKMMKIDALLAKLQQPAPERISARVWQNKADRAYCDCVDLHKRPECLGWKQKVKDGTFGQDELDAHTKAAGLLGEHRAFAEVAAHCAAAQPSGERLCRCPEGVCYLHPNSPGFDKQCSLKHPTAAQPSGEQAGELRKALHDMGAGQIELAHLLSEAENSIVQMRQALTVIVEGGDCDCDHDTEDCCAETDYYCPGCIAGKVLLSGTEKESKDADK